MRSKLKPVFAFATVAALAFAGIGASNAATVEVAGVSGQWTALLPPSGPTYVKGIGTNEVSWGTPFNPSVSKKQSGYSFVGAASGPLETGTIFNLGRFTHRNFVIESGTSITGAGLSVGINLMIGGLNRVVNTAFNFAHWETNNFGEDNGLCANGRANYSRVNSNGCADRVTLLNNASSNQTFELDGLTYILEITGFIRKGKPFSEFWTKENKANSAILQARFNLVDPGPGPGPSPVPLPAAAWLMLAGLGALGLTRFRRKAATV